MIGKLSSRRVKKSMTKDQENNESPIESTERTVDAPPVRVYGFVDGFNLYHALEKFEPAVPVSDPNRYQKYKWLCAILSYLSLTRTANTAIGKE